MLGYRAIGLGKRAPNRPDLTLPSMLGRMHWRDSKLRCVKPESPSGALAGRPVTATPAHNEAPSPIPSPPELKYQLLDRSLA